MANWLLTLTLASVLFLYAEGKGYAGYVLINERLYHSDELPCYSEEKHYNLAVRAFDACDYAESAKHFRILALNFSECEISADAWFFAGVSYYKLSDLDLANSALSCYLTSKTAPHYFEEAIYYKLCIADRLACGERIHPIESYKLPKCITARDLALEIYDEVISMLPTSEMAAKALFKKANLQWSFELRRDAIATYQTLIRRFPKNEMVQDSYLNILYIYLAESRIEYQNPDIFSFAEITLRRFEQDFPKDEKIETGECILATIREVFASGLYNIAEFYMRTCETRAATIYYQMVIAKFPTTKTANRALCQLRLICPNGMPQVISCKKEIECDEKYDIEEL